MSSNDFIGRPHDFDFLVGRWKVANRRLRRRFAGSDDWEHFDGVQQAWSHLDGVLSVDEIVLPTLGFSGASVRALDLARGRWAIHWIHSAQGTLFPPVHGGWCGDRGEFRGTDEDDGCPVQVRFVWQRLGADRARWEQSFSLDGTAWELNWVMDLSRL